MSWKSLGTVVPVLAFLFAAEPAHAESVPPGVEVSISIRDTTGLWSPGLSGEVRSFHSLSKVTLNDGQTITTVLPDDLQLLMISDDAYVSPTRGYDQQKDIRRYCNAAIRDSLNRLTNPGEELAELVFYIHIRGIAGSGSWYEDDGSTAQLDLQKINTCWVTKQAQ